MPQRPVSRRERPAKPALSREGVVAAALDVLRAEGMERLTMRRIAAALDTGPASLYVYVRDTDELHAAVLDELLGGLDLAPATTDGGAGDWRERLWTLLRAYGEVLRTEPGLGRVALVTPLSGPHYLALLDAVLALLAEGGMTPDRAAWAVDALLLVTTASAVEHGTRARTPSAADRFADLATAVREARPDVHPHVAALSGLLLSGPGPARARWAFDVLVNGALTTPRPVPEDQP